MSCFLFELVMDGVIRIFKGMEFYNFIGSNGKWVTTHLNRVRTRLYHHKFYWFIYACVCFCNSVYFVLINILVGTKWTQNTITSWDLTTQKWNIDYYNTLSYLECYFQQYWLSASAIDVNLTTIKEENLQFIWIINSNIKSLSSVFQIFWN